MYVIPTDSGDVTRVAFPVDTTGPLDGPMAATCGPPTAPVGTLPSGAVPPGSAAPAEGTAPPGATPRPGAAGAPPSPCAAGAEATDPEAPLTVVPQPTRSSVAASASSR